MAFFFGIIGGAIGYFSLKDTNPQRANHVMKWGLIWSVIWSVFWFVVFPAIFLTAAG